MGSHPTLFVHAHTKPEKSWKPESFVHVLSDFLREVEGRNPVTDVIR
jgi:hypothetical protein